MNVKIIRNGLKSIWKCVIHIQEHSGVDVKLYQNIFHDQNQGLGEVQTPFFFVVTRQVVTVSALRVRQ